jgi:hypothetical protein
MELKDHNRHGRGVKGKRLGLVQIESAIRYSGDEP